ncbi:MAG: two-component regulator propeller domain-containing protein [Reichenbachiella sp.]
MHLGVEEGLSQNSAFCFQQDHLQRIWVGTREGLNCFDGEKVRTYRPILNDTSSLMDFKIEKLAQMGRFLFALGRSGLSVIDLNTMFIRRVPLEGCIDVEVNSDKVFIATVENGLYEMDTVSFNPNLVVDILPDLGIYSISNQGDELLIGTSSNGLIAYNPIKRASRNIEFTAKIKNIKVALTTISGNLIIGTEFDGVYYINKSSNKIEHFTKGEKNWPLSTNLVRDIVESEDGVFWVGTFLGIAIIDMNEHKVTWLRPNASDPRGLSHGSVFDLMIDAQRNMWVGTYFGGVNYTNLNKQYITFYTQEGSFRESKNSIIGKMDEDSKGNLWIASEGEGLLYMASNSNTYSIFNSGLSDEVKNIRSILIDNDNEIYIGSHLNGLIVADIKSGSYKKIGEGNRQSPNIVNDIIKYGDKFLLGCRKGLILYDPIDESFSDSFDENNPREVITESIYSLHYSSTDGLIWIGTEFNGLITYDPKDGTQTRYTAVDGGGNNLKGNSIYMIKEYDDQNVWVATLGGGLSKYDRTKKSFITFSQESHNLPSNFICGVSESSSGDLWVATSNGLSKLDMKANSFSNYSLENGFPYAELNQGGLHLSKEKHLYIGSIQGLISVEEGDLLNQSDSTKMVFSSLYVNHKIVIPNDPTEILRKDISVTDEITLLSNHTSFSIEYAACNYSGSFNRYKYRLIGFDQDWIEGRNNPVATYSNIPSGKYQFVVQALDPVYNRSIAQRKLNVEKLPPFYATWYAYTIYVIFVLSLIIIIGQVWITSAKLKLEKIDKENIRNLNKSKLQFFTDISHEFMTPLTLILGSIEGLIKGEELNHLALRKLRLTYKNALRLKHLSSELLDFRKLEQGFMRMVIREHELTSYLQDIVSTFRDQAAQKEVKILSEFSKSKIRLWYDHHQIDKVFFNLISNALKFVEEGSGEIKLKIEEEDSIVAIYVIDNGPGISEENVEKVFDRFYQSKKIKNTETEGSGLGLTISEGIISAHGGSLFINRSSQGGTEFKVVLKKGNDHFNPEDISNESNPPDVYNENSLVSTYTEILNIEGGDKSSDVSNFEENRLTLLIVEDNKEVLFLLEEILSADYNLVLTEDGEEGVLKAKEVQPDMIISDIMLPKMNGNQLCAKLKNNVQTSHIPIILLTAKTGIENKIDGLNVGADDYITKPFNIAYLKTRIVNIFENRNRLQEKFSKADNTEVVLVTKNRIDQEYMEQVKEVVEAHINDDSFGVDTLVKEMGQSRTLFFKKMKTITGQTPNDFILNYRLKKSAELLKLQIEKNVAEISYEVGFASPKYFSKCFKNSFGMTPSEFRKNQGIS